MNIARAFVRDGRLRSGWRVTLYLVCYLVGLLIVQTPIVGLYVAHLLSQGLATPTSLMSALQPSQLPLWLITVLKLAELLMVLAFTYLLGRLVDRRAWVGFGFRRARGWLGDLILGAAVAATQMCFVVAIEWAAGWLSIGRPSATVLIKGLLDASFSVVLFGAVALGEELIFRGYVQTNLREGAGLPVALVVSSVLFGLFHALNPNVTRLGLLNIALAGVVLGYGYAVTGNLWLPIAYHFGWNLVQGPILSLPVSGVRYGGLLTVIDRGAAPLFTGGAFGPEGGILGTLVLLTALPIFWWWGRERNG
jgi:membrane protease YdiL (CAAX protease family)